MGLKEKIANLPNSPGVYLMKDETGGVIYVGKAKDLMKRVSTYFRPNAKLSERVRILASKVKDLEILQTSTSAEALLYENSLIKQHNPRYNVSLRDDKSYPMLKLTLNERFPRLVITRIRKDDGAIYYGPYTSASLLKEALAIMRRIFPLRTCGRLSKDLCLNFHIGQCLGPCVDKVSELTYRSLVEEVKLFLDGKRDELIELVSLRMREAARKQNFEEAGVLRQRLEALTSLKENRILYSPKGTMEELGAVLGLKRAPSVIEAFDVSNIMGELAVGSMVCFVSGRPKKNMYKRFKIKTVGSMDDYAMIREVVRRRYARILKEGSSLPDLVLIDGGRGHLQVALDELGELKIEVPAIAIAKELEKIYIKEKEPIILPRDSKALHLVQKIRDEAHRFAITYHKLLAKKGIVHSELDEIMGIGPKRKRELLSHFGSVDSIKKATASELLKVRGMNEKAVQAVIGYFKK